MRSPRSVTPASALAGLAVVCAAASPAAVDAAPPAPQTVARGHVAALDLAANDRDTSILAWVDARAGAVRARLRAGGGRLGRTRTLSHRGYDAGSPAVAIDPRGDALACWVESRGGRQHTIWARVMRRDGRWLAPERLGRSAKSAPQPRAALAPSGEAVVVWRYDTVLKAAFRRWGGRFSAARVVGPPGAQAVVRYDGTSRAWLVYAPYPAAGALRIASSRPGARRFAHLRRIGAAPASFPALSATCQGRVAVAYRRSPVPGAEDEAGPIDVVLREPGGRWSDPHTVSPPAYVVAGQPPRALAERPAVAAAWDGTVAVAWLQLTSTGPDPAVGEEAVTAAVRDAGAPSFGPPVRVGTGAQFTYPAVAVDAARRTAVLWRGTRDERIVASIRLPGGPFGAPEAVSASHAFIWPQAAAGATPIAGWQEPHRLVVLGVLGAGNGG